jgi:solute carrier family 35 protein F1/2
VPFPLIRRVLLLHFIAEEQGGKVRHVEAPPYVNARGRPVQSDLEQPVASGSDDLPDYNKVIGNDTRT